MSRPMPGAGKRPLLAADVEHGLAADGPAVGPQPLLPGRGRRGHSVGPEALDPDVAAVTAVDDVHSQPADEHVVTRAADQHVVAVAADQDIGPVAAVGGEPDRPAARENIRPTASQRVRDLPEIVAPRAQSRGAGLRMTSQIKRWHGPRPPRGRRRSTTTDVAHAEPPEHHGSERLNVDTGAFEMDDDRERRGRVLLLGKGAVLAHRLARPLAAESDETEQWGSGTADGEPRYRNARGGAAGGGLRHRPRLPGADGRPRTRAGAGVRVAARVSEVTENRRWTSVWCIAAEPRRGAGSGC